MSNMKRLYEDIIEDWKLNVFTTKQLSEKYGIDERMIEDAIAFYEETNKD